MDTTVMEIGERVVAALEAAGYATLTIDQYRNAIRWLDLLAHGQGGVYSLALGAEFTVMTASPQTGRSFSPLPRTDFARLARVFDSYVLTGEVDLSIKRRSRARVVPQSQELAALLNAWSDKTGQRGLATATRGSYGRAACDYLLYLEAGGMTSLREAGEASVPGFLESLRGQWAETAMWSVVSNFRPFLNRRCRTTPWTIPGSHASP